MTVAGGSVLEPLRSVVLSRPLGVQDRGEIRVGTDFGPDVTLTVDRLTGSGRLGLEGLFGARACGLNRSRIESATMALVARSQRASALSSPAPSSAAERRSSETLPESVARSALFRR